MWPVDSPPRWVDRSQELATLRAGVEALRQGGSAAVWVEGEPGIGKSSLVVEALTGTSELGWDIGWGIADQLTERMPLSVMQDCLQVRPSSPDPRRAAIAALLASRGGDRGPITVTSDPGLRFRAVDAFADLAEELALAGPLVIGVDDLQWADASSLLTLAALGRRAEYLPVALIACFRPSPRSPELDQLAASLEGPPGRYLSLGGLGAQAVADLAADAVGAAPDARDSTDDQ